VAIDPIQGWSVDVAMGLTSSDDASVMRG